MNQIPQRQNTEAFQRLLKARSHLYSVAARFQYSQLALSVVFPLAGAIVVGFFLPEQRSTVALIALVITLLDVAFIDRKMRRTLVLAAQVSEEFDCALLEMNWNSFTAGKKVTPETVSTAAASYYGPPEKLIDWYPVAVGRAPIHMARLICQHTNLWYDGTLRRAYSSWIFWIGLACALIYSGVGIHQKLGVDEWANNAAIGAPVVIWAVREYFRQRDTSDAVQNVKSNGECVWEDAVSGTNSPEETTAQSREFQNGIFVRRANNPLLFPFIYWFKRDSMEVQMNVSAEDRLKAIGVA